MTRTTRTRRLSLGATAALVLATLPLAGAAAPAQAADGCMSEVAPTADPFPLPTGPGCDDTTPPDTTIDGVAPSPNDDDWVRADHVSFAFSGAYTDADEDPITYECTFFAEEPVDWTACTSPATYSDLAETTTTPYTFRVRAVDSGDNAIDLTAAPLFPVDTDQPDLDPTPAERTVRVDTVKPSAFIIDGPSDPNGSDWPILAQPRTSFLLDASEPDVDYRCQLDGRTVGCHQGRVALTGLSGGDRVFAVKVTDPAGNESSQATDAQFTVPYDLRSAKGWKRVAAKGAFAGSLLQTRTKGARIRFSAPNMREFRFRAPAGHGLGKVRVRVGQGVWKTFDLGNGPASKARWYVVRDESSPLFRGPVQIESLSAGKQVRIDALVFPPS
jgi:hypothetical protein